MNTFWATGRGRWLLTTGMTFVYFGSVVAATAVTIPLALRYLGRDQYGLWAVSSQLLSYIFLLDGGLSRAMQRLVGEAVGHPEDHAASRRFFLLLVLSIFTACLLLFLAVVVSTPGLRLLAVPPHLLAVGRELFLSIMALQAVGYMLGPFSAVLYSQNRAYISGALSVLTVWLNAGAFILFLVRGDGLLSYVYANLLCLPFSALGVLYFALGSLGCPKIRFLMPIRGDLKEILLFTGWTFLGTLLAEGIAALPTLVITKFVGLGGMALFYISFRLAFFLQRLSIIPFQSLGPRWQALYLQGQSARLRQEFSTGVALTLLSGLVLGICFVVFLKPLIILWVGGKLYGGTLLTISLGFYLTVYLLGNVLSTPFVLAKRLGPLAGAQLLEFIFCVPVCIFFAREFGTGGVIAGSIALSVLFSVGYCWRKGPSLLGLSSNTSGLLRGHRRALIVQGGLVILAMAWVWWADAFVLPLAQLLLGGGLLAAASVILFLGTTGRAAFQMIRQRRFDFELFSNPSS